MLDASRASFETIQDVSGRRQMAIQDETIGFIGLGAMGKGMASNCVRKGFKLVVHDIRPEPVADLEALGASSAQSVPELVAQCSTIITVLPTGREVDEIVMGAEGIFAHAKPDTLVMDLSTIDPETTDKLHDTAKAGGFRPPPLNLPIY